MAITSFTVPNNLAPAFNPFIIEMLSDNINEPSFRYVVEIKDKLNSNALVSRLNLVPRANDGVGYTDLSMIVKNLLGDYAHVEIEVGEMFAQSYTYTDIQDDGIYVQLVGSTTPTYIAGDQINIEQADGGTAMPNMEGLFTVVSVSGDNVTISRLWADVNYSTIAGVVTYADNRKTEFLNLTNDDVYFMPSSFSFGDFLLYNESEYELSSTPSATNLLWTNVNKYGSFTVRPTQDIFCLLFQQITGAFRVTIRAFNKAGNQSAYYYDVTNDSPVKSLRFSGDFGTISTVGGATLPVIKDDTVRLFVRITQGVDNLSSGYNFLIDHRCSINDYEILFKDLLGSFSSFAFELKSKENIQVVKSSYRKELPIIYNTDDFGYKIYYSQRTQILDLQTNWMTEVNSLYFDQLVSSPETYIKIDGDYYACEVLTSEALVETKRNNSNMIKKAIQVKLSNPQRVNG